MLQKVARSKITSSESFMCSTEKTWDTKTEKAKQTEENLIFLGLNTQKKEKVMFTVQRICLVTDLEHWYLLGIYTELSFSCFPYVKPQLFP